jgi:hypothetical protein
VAWSFLGRQPRLFKRVSMPSGKTILIGTILPICKTYAVIIYRYFKICIEHVLIYRRGGGGGGGVVFFFFFGCNH